MSVSLAHKEFSAEFQKEEQGNKATTLLLALAVASNRKLKLKVLPENSSVLFEVINIH